MAFSYLSFCEAEAVGELFPLRSHHVMVLLERVFEPQQLRGRERRPDPFGLPGQRVVQKKALRTRFVTCERAETTEGHCHEHVLLPSLGLYV